MQPSWHQAGTRGPQPVPSPPAGQHLRATIYQTSCSASKHSPQRGASTGTAEPKTTVQDLEKAHGWAGAPAQRLRPVYERYSNQTRTVVRKMSIQEGPRKPNGNPTAHTAPTRGICEDSLFPNAVPAQNRPSIALGAPAQLNTIHSGSRTAGQRPPLAWRLARLAAQNGSAQQQARCPVPTFNLPSSRRFCIKLTTSDARVQPQALLLTF